MITYTKPRDTLGLGVEPELSNEEWNCMQNRLDDITDNRATEDLDEYEEEFKEFDKLQLTNN